MGEAFARNIIIIIIIMMKDYAHGIHNINYANRNPFISVQSFDLSLALEANMKSRDVGLGSFISVHIVQPGDKPPVTSCSASEA